MSKFTVISGEIINEPTVYANEEKGGNSLLFSIRFKNGNRDDKPGTNLARINYYTKSEKIIPYLVKGTMITISNSYDAIKEIAGEPSIVYNAFSGALSIDKFVPRDSNNSSNSRNSDPYNSSDVQVPTAQPVNNTPQPVNNTPVEEEHPLF